MLVDISVVEFAPSNFKCSSSNNTASGGQHIKELLEACFTATTVPFLSYKWQDVWRVEVEAVVYHQPVCIECHVYRLQSEVKSYVILFTHTSGESTGCSMLCDKIRYQLLRQESVDDSPVEQQHVMRGELTDWWGDGFEEDTTVDTPAELYPGSMSMDTETMQRTTAVSTAYHLSVEVRIDAARTLAYSCATHPNRQLFLECDGAHKLEDMLSVGTELEIQKCAVSVLLACLKDPELKDTLRTELQISSGVVKQSLAELAEADLRAPMCLELLL